MAAPTAGPFTVFPQGPGQPTDNLTGLGNNQARGLGIVGMATVDAKDYKIDCVKITTGVIPGSPNGSGSASLYVALSEGGANFTDGLLPNSTDGVAEANKFIAAQPGPAGLQGLLVQKIFCPATATVYSFNAFSLLQKVGYVPTFFSIYVVNNTGASFGAAAAGFTAGFKLITFN